MASSRRQVAGSRSWHASILLCECAKTTHCSRVKSRQSEKGSGGTLKRPPTHWAASALLLQQVQRASFTETQVVTGITQLSRPSFQTCHTWWHAELDPGTSDAAVTTDTLEAFPRLLLLKLRRLLPQGFLLALLLPLLLYPLQKNLQLDRSHCPTFKALQPPSCQRMPNCLSPS